MARFLLTALVWTLVAAALPAAGAGSGAAVTVIGAVAAPNRPPFDGFHDAFFKFSDYSFDRAFAFDRAALAGLAQTTVSARAEGWPAAVTASGPRLRDVLKTAGVAPGATLRIVALDGYTLSLNPEELAAREWILAIDANGAALGLGDRGPAWLLHDTGGAAATAEEEAKWVWSVYLVVAEGE
jgi:hypothetical protein